MGLAHLNLVSVLSFSKAWYHRPRYRFLVSVLSFFEENAQKTKPMSNRRLLSTTQIKSVAHIGFPYCLNIFEWFCSHREEEHFEANETKRKHQDCRHLVPLDSPTKQETCHFFSTSSCLAERA